MKKKNSFLKFIIFFGAVFFVWWYGTCTLNVTVTEIYSDKVYDEITIVQITDLHGSSFGSDNSSLIDKIREQNPDIVCITGDMYTYGDVSGMETAISLICNLHDEFVVYFVSGEHDYAPEFLQSLEDYGVNVFNYQDEIITIKNTDIHIYGIDNVYYSSTFDLSNEFESDEENFSLLLAHISNFDAFESFGVDLTLCGDTHGGQVRLPYVGAIFNRGIWLPEIYGYGDVAYTDGLYEKNNSYLYVSSGLGTVYLPFRFLNRPEVSVIKILPQN